MMPDAPAKPPTILQTLGPSWVAVYDDAKNCLGHVLNRGPRRGYQALDASDQTIGFFADLKAAADAVANKDAG
jgi:hypothetical protein